MQKSHPEMALKHQFGTSPEASLTNSKADSDWED